MLTMYFKILMNDRMDELYESLGIEPVCAQEYPDYRTAEKTQRVSYSERLGNVFIWIGETLIQHARKNTLSQEAMS